MRRDHYVRVEDPGWFAANATLATRRRRLTIGELAGRLSINERRLHRLLHGDVSPHYSEIPRFAQELGVPPELLAWTEPAAFAVATRPK